jgi:4-hydroxy 2-oxovalerate aldolase
MELLDCTLRDGGYYNAWDFPRELVDDYLSAMASAGVDVVELGFRSLKNESFQGPYAFTTDHHLDGLVIPEALTLGVMVNAAELVNSRNQQRTLERLFPRSAAESRVDLVRVACHIHEFSEALPAAYWLQKQGYRVGFNLMQVADRDITEITNLAKLASDYPLDVLYFADSMGSMTPEHTVRIVQAFKEGWSGPLGVHAHDNMGLALQNTLAALEHGVSWMDATVTGMGRGPGNTRTEELAFEVGEREGKRSNLIPLMSSIRRHFQPLRQYYGWGTNLYYYLAGKYAIHPTYIQEMLGDSRYDDEDIFSVIHHLREEGGKKFNLSTLDAARHFYQGPPSGSWRPVNWIEGREVMLLGTGPGVARHQEALKRYVELYEPLVIALNAQNSIDEKLIDLRVACHPVRLLADCDAHMQLSQPLITPYSMLPEEVKSELEGKQILDFGLNVQPAKFEFHETYCTTPTSLVMAYAFAVVTSGKSRRVLMAGFDGYPSEDPRNEEMNQVVKSYLVSESAIPLVAITPTRYDLERQSIYGLIS